MAKPSLHIIFLVLLLFLYIIKGEETVRTGALHVELLDLISAVHLSAYNESTPSSDNISSQQNETLPTGGILPIYSNRTDFTAGADGDTQKFDPIGVSAMQDNTDGLIRSRTKRHGKGHTKLRGLLKGIGGRGGGGRGCYSCGGYQQPVYMPQPVYVSQPVYVQRAPVRTYSAPPPGNTCDPCNRPPPPPAPVCSTCGGGYGGGGPYSYASSSSTSYSYGGRKK